MADQTPPTTGTPVTATTTTPAVPPVAGATPFTAAVTTPATVTDEHLAKFEIPDTVKQQFPDLVPLVIQTESMNDDERQYWFQILPIMTDEQVEKLRGILVHEKEQLSKLDQEYEQELTKLNEKHLLEWKEHEAREKREQLRSAESQTEAEEAANEAALLAQLSAMDDSAPQA